MNMTEILKSAVERGASDIFVVAGLPLTYKVRGEQQRETAVRPMTIFRSRSAVRDASV